MSARATQMGRARPVQLRSFETRERILEAAQMMLVEVGRDRLTTAHVAVCAGVSIGTVYRYFADRAVIIEAVLERDEVHVAQLEVFRAAAAVAAAPQDRRCSAALERAAAALVHALMRLPADTSHKFGRAAAPAAAP